MVLIALSLVTLSSVEIRHSRQSRDMAIARANARLALTTAIGQLQLHLGPDQRVSATSSILANGGARHWTGVWRTRREDGTSFLERDPRTGSLRDLRAAPGWMPEQEVLAWLVSGDAHPAAALPPGHSVELVGPGSVTSGDDRVRVPTVPVVGDDGNRHRIAWWVGDLGVRANVAVADPHRNPGPSAPEAVRYYPTMATQQAEAEMM
ncbi:MAG: hypothetical protein HKN82_15300, partial [Akkermansiaceae bacterium]|nr:hypothetical protein [Akkermansiaceae bacterium]